MSQTSLAIQLHQNLASKLNNKVKPHIFNLFKPSQIGKLQNFVPTPIKVNALELALNRLLQDPIAEGQFEFLDNRVIGIHISDANIFISLSSTNNALRCVHISNEEYSKNEANLTIEIIDAIKLLNQEVDPDTLFFKRRLKIGGDTELAHWVKNTIDSIDPEIIPAFFRQLLKEYRNSISK